MVYTYTVEYYLAIKNEALPFVRMWSSFEGIMLSAIGVAEREVLYARGGVGVGAMGELFLFHLSLV